MMRSRTSSVPVDLVSTVVGASAGLKDPRDVVMDNCGNLYIADKANHRILQVDRAANVTPFAGNGTMGYSGDSQKATSATLNNPMGLAIDSSGNLYITDTGNQVVRKVDGAGIISTYAGSGDKGFDGDGGPATSAKLDHPCSIDFDSAGNLYIADTYNHAIRKVDSTGTISTFAGRGRAGDGQATSARLLSPYGLAVDSNDNVYIADTQHHRLRKVDTAGILSTIAGTGTKGFGGDGGPATSAQLHAPNRIAIDGSGNVYFSDNWNQRVRKVNSAGIISTVVGGGTSRDSDYEGPATGVRLSNPEGIAVISSGSLYVVDSGFKRILKFLEPFTFDPASLIPLRSASYLKNHFVARLTGKAIAGDEEYEIHFDTGSWNLTIPYGCLNKDPGILTVLETDVRVYGHLADKVKGEIALKSEDGQTTYSIEDYVFYALKNEDGSDMPCNRNQPFNAGLMGAFPGTGSLAYALAEKYSQAKGLGFGMGLVSHAEKTYLLLGADPKIVTDRIHWRTDKPAWREQDTAFFPDAVNGFTIRLQFSNVADPIVVQDLSATIDTGAPEMILRLNAQDPQNTPTFSDYFTTQGYWIPWNNADYNQDARQITGSGIVTVEFKDSNGMVSSYSFEANDTTNVVAVGAWNGNVPWKITTDTPRYRFNLGETIFRYAPVVFFDVKNKRVGLHFE